MPRSIRRPRSSAASKSEQTRQRIVSAAAVAFRERGVGGVGLRDIMKRAGLTPGGFYFHFYDKDDLFADASREAFDGSAAWLFEPVERAPPGGRLRAFIDTYLSAEHRDHPESGCLVAALGGDAARGNRKQRRVLSDVAGKMLDRIAPHVSGPDLQAQRRRASLLLSSMAGVLMVSRLLTDNARSDALLAGARQFFATSFGES